MSVEVVVIYRIRCRKKIIVVKNSFILISHVRRGVLYQVGEYFRSKMSEMNVSDSARVLE